MAYRFNETEIDALANGVVSQDRLLRDIHAGAGGCSKCGCNQFEHWGANADQCGNSSCAHSWSDHY